MPNSAVVSSQSDADDLFDEGDNVFDDDVDRDEFLNARNVDFTRALIPTLVYIVILMVVGLVGNTVVFLVYYKRLKPSVINTYILAITVCDLLTNLIVLPADFFEIRFHYTYSSDFACKITRTIRGYLVLLSALILTAVAIVRQKTICVLQLSSPVSLRQVHLSLVICCLLALVYSVPYFILSGRSQRRLRGTNITGTACGIADEYFHSTFQQAFLALLNVTFVVDVVIMVVAYVRIALFILPYKREGKSMRITKVLRESRIVQRTDTVGNEGQRKRMSTSVVLDDETSYYSTSVAAETESQAERDAGENAGPQETPAVTQLQLLSVPAPTERSPPRRGKTHTSDASKAKSAFKGKSVPARTTYMLFVLTAVFILNFLPYLAIVSISLFNPRMVKGININITAICTRSFLLNSAVHPIVYSLSSAKVRGECISLFKSCKCPWSSN